MDDSGFKVRQQTSDQRQTTSVEATRHTPGVVFGVIIAELMCAGYRVEVYGQEYLRQAQGALVVSNHRRDSDGPIIANALLQRRGLHIDGVAPYFVAREDLFRKGFLEHYLHNWPVLVRTLLGGLSMGSMLYAMHLRPMRRIQELTMDELLSDVCTAMGDVPLSQVLRKHAALRFAKQLGHPVEALRVSQALGASGRLLYQRYAYRRLTRAALRKLMPFERTIINRQLQVFANLLDEGETVILEPEGRVSPDGYFHRPRQALHYLLNAPSKIPQVLPVALSYDFLRRGRPRVLVRFGPLRDDLSGLDRRQTNQAAQRAVLELWTVNASHLAARYLHGEKTMRLERNHRRDLESFVAEMAERCQTLGVPIDPDLLDARKRQIRIKDCLAFCHKRKSHHAKRELMFLNNELQAIAAIHPGLLAGPSQ